MCVFTISMIISDMLSCIPRHMLQGAAGSVGRLLALWPLPLCLRGGGAARQEREAAHAGQPPRLPRVE